MIKRSAAPSAVWLVSERVLKALGTGLLFVALARYFGPADYGRLATALALGAISKTIVGLGLQGIVQRELTRRPEEAPRIVGTFLGMGFAATVLCGLALTALALWAVDDLPTRRMTLLLAWIGLPQVLSGAELWFMAQFHPRPVVVVRNISWAVFLLLRVALMLAHAPLLWFAWVALLDWSVAYAAVWLLYRRRCPSGGRIRWSREMAQQWLSEGWPLVATVILGLGAERFLGLILQRFDSLLGAGEFGLALKCIDPWWQVAGVAAVAYLPRFAMALQQSHADCLRFLERYLDLSMAVTVGVASVATVIAPFAIATVFGDDYRKTCLPLILLCWAAPPIFSAQARLQYLIAHGHLLVELPSCLVNTVLQLGLSLWWIPRHGSAGAAAAITCSAWATVFLVPWMVPQARVAARAQWRAFGFALRLPAITRELLQAAQAGLRGALR